MLPLRVLCPFVCLLAGVAACSANGDLNPYAASGDPDGSVGSRSEQLDSCSATMPCPVGQRCEAQPACLGGILNPGPCRIGSVSFCVAITCTSDTQCPSGSRCQRSAPTGSASGTCVAGCRRDQDCSDSVVCNGTERCAPAEAGADSRGCVAGQNPCPIRGRTRVPCVELMRACEGSPTCSLRPGGPDSDGDGEASTDCGGADCDDANPARYPGALEICNRVDEDCNPATVGGDDADRDGFYGSTCCNPTYSGNDACGTDCDDLRATVNPSAQEACNGLDDNCDGSIDNGIGNTIYRDADGDGHGTSAETRTGCAAGPGWSFLNNDCNDANNEVNPGAPEVCNSRDDDCDGMIDESVLNTLYRDMDGDGFGAGAPLPMACGVVAGTSARLGDCDDTNPRITPGQQRCTGTLQYQICEATGVWRNGVCPATGCFNRGDGTGYCM